MSINLQECAHLRACVQSPYFLSKKSIEYNAGMMYLIKLLNANVAIHDTGEWTGSHKPSGKFLHLLRNTLVHNPTQVNPHHIKEFIAKEIDNLENGLVISQDARLYKCYSDIPYAGNASEAFINRSNVELKAAEKECYDDLSDYQGQAGYITADSVLRGNRKAAVEHLVMCTFEICEQLLSCPMISHNPQVVCLRDNLRLCRNAVSHSDPSFETQGVLEALIQIKSSKLRVGVAPNFQPRSVALKRKIGATSPENGQDEKRHCR